MPNRIRAQTVWKSNKFPELAEALKRLGQTAMTVGVHDDAGRYPVTEEQPDPPEVSAVALAQEFGTDTIPARPFFYPTLAAKEPQIKSLLAKNLAAIVDIGKHKGIDSVTALSRVGFAIQTWVQNTIKSNVGPSLGWTAGSAAYLARRRAIYPESGTRTLIASGLLLRSVRFKVTTPGKDVIEGPATGPEPLIPGGRSKDANAQGTAGKAARAVARDSAKSFRDDRKAAQARAKADPAAFRKAFEAQRGSHGLPKRGGL